MMSSNFAYYTALAFEGVAGIFGIRLYEEPHYDVVARLGDRVEIRRYGPRLAAEVELSSSGQAKMSEAFGLLFSYIAGANHVEKSGSAKIAMTVPVEVRRNENIAMTVPVQVSEASGAVRMLFYLPTNLTADTAPKPTDLRVRLIAVPGETIATLRFSGSAGDSGKRQLELMDILKKSRWNPTGTPYQLSYDAPFTLPFLRRNEAAVAVAAVQ